MLAHAELLPLGQKLDLFSELRAKQIPKVEHATHTNGQSMDTQGCVAKLHID